MNSYFVGFVAAPTQRGQTIVMLHTYLQVGLTEGYKRKKQGMVTIQPNYQIYTSDKKYPVYTAKVHLKNNLQYVECVFYDYKLEKWFPLQGERGHSFYFWSFQKHNSGLTGTVW